MPAAWFLHSQECNVAFPNHCSPGAPVRADTLEACGVYTRTVDPATLHERDPTDEKKRTCAQRLAWNLGYQGQEEVTLTADAQEELREHLNLDEQMCVVESGVLYLDVRDAEDRWIRVEAKAGDLLVVPRGIYHRLVPASDSPPVKLLRLLRNSTVFQPIPREGEPNTERAAEARAAHEDHIFYMSHPPKETILGPANGVDNVLVTTPRDFDDTLATLKAGLAPGDVLVLFIKGASDRKTHRSWCPPCVLAEPVVQRAVEAAKRKRRVVYVQCIVERSVYLGNPEYAYRRHPLLNITSIPFLLVHQQGDKELTELCCERELGEGFESWVEKL
ncbi:putative 1,2-Dihydroxy-3-keto-5-methylthiopentene dioxygenase [Trypanosoma rangeli]|uniref:acireductone dioxygenase (Fe(2+)-requiring) n=1 Tax=Trypanosoma rangeli TaxID=5698 RepID=A0A422N1T2_TRYRA|nr:putative 1,2-Dihydroxy-3-keto-5-methylthiopentene dioxygenase [Trypanosoma rangeli]RNE99432.1 putative 1,2-Dihydroxy-3-keto-5-methylthiopentene dioxygenase [Trypanosoma rangeli]|eukprot:RNE99432.1 putative 1,2-Dihydroxy-3-keto-5-methylthiopentene dioxygenase [Trypanosoma rangeli]